MIKYLLLTISVLAWCAGVFAQCIGLVSPEPICTEVELNGDVTVTIDPASMGAAVPADIDRFELWSSKTGTGFAMVQSITIAGSFPTTMVHAGANGQVDLNYYQIKAFCSTVPPTILQTSSTIQTIILNSTVVDDTLINLTWNYDGLTSPNLSPAPAVSIFKSYPTPGSIPGPPYQASPGNYTDTVVTCDDEGYYSITVTNIAQGCFSVSSIDSVKYKDRTPPPEMTIDSVSFDSFFNVPLIGWSINPAPDTRGYFIYATKLADCDIQFSFIDTIMGRFNTTYLDTNFYDGTGTVEYSIRPFDFCDNAAPSRSPCVGTMKLSHLISICDKSIELNWNSYDGFESGPNVVYNVYVNEGGLGDKLIGTTTSTFFVDENPAEGGLLNYKIEAVERDGLGPFTASSNSELVDAEFLKFPEHSYLQYATVFNPNDVRVQIYSDPQSDVKRYVLKRSLDTNDMFSTVAIHDVADVAAPADSFVVIKDPTADTEKFIYYYIVESIDSCGELMTISNFGSTIRLSVASDDIARTNRLKWNNYVGWESRVLAYKVYRFLDDRPFLDPITVLPDTGTHTSFVDSISSLTNASAGKFCYYVEALEEDPSYNLLDGALSKSNRVCAYQTNYISVPTAFTPNGDGKNEIFKPVLIYHDFEQYELYIMNRHGEVIYSSTSPATGWDGTFNGKPSPVGAYVYVVRYSAATGEQFERQGTLSLIR